MTSYIIIICSYSIFHYFLMKFKEADKFNLPKYLLNYYFQYRERENEYLYFYLFNIAFPVFISFIIALFIYDYLQVILYTLGLLIGIINLLKLIEVIIKYVIIKMNDVFSKRINKGDVLFLLSRTYRIFEALNYKPNYFYYSGILVLITKWITILSIIYFIVFDFIIYNWFN